MESGSLRLQIQHVQIIYDCDMSSVLLRLCRDENFSLLPTVQCLLVHISAGIRQKVSKVCAAHKGRTSAEIAITCLLTPSTSIYKLVPTSCRCATIAPGSNFAIYIIMTSWARNCWSRHIFPEVVETWLVVCFIHATVMSGATMGVTTTVAFGDSHSTLAA